MKRILLLYILIFPLISNAQQWKRQRKEVIVGVGASNFLGDLGGANRVGTYYLRDLEMSQTKTNFMAAYRFRYSQNIYFKGNFNYGRITGDDLLTQKEDRRVRRLNFRSDIFEVSGTFEYAITEERIKGRYIRGQSRFPVNIYTILGLGVTFFNPKGKYNGQTTAYATEGKWYALRNLGTEGQGLENGPGKKYKLWTIVIPFGVGFKYPITNTWHVGLEYKLVKTFSDYIDDVGGFYYNNDKIKAERGELAAYFADPSKDYINRGGEVLIKGATDAKQKRGNGAKNDTYMFGTTYVAYKFIKGSNKSRVKF
jgi:Domain of unknown function (DUF6089)